MFFVAYSLPLHFPMPTGCIPTFPWKREENGLSPETTRALIDAGIKCIPTAVDVIGSWIKRRKEENCPADFWRFKKEEENWVGTAISVAASLLPLLFQKKEENGISPELIKTGISLIPTAIDVVRSLWPKKKEEENWIGTAISVAASLLPMLLKKEENCIYNPTPVIDIKKLLGMKKEENDYDPWEKFDDAVYKWEREYIWHRPIKEEENWIGTAISVAASLLPMLLKKEENISPEMIEKIRRSILLRAY